MHLVEATPGAPRWSSSVPAKSEHLVPRAVKTVLLAEDNDDLRYVMECSLQAMGYAVIACADGQLALSAFHSHATVDVLLTDFEMPRKSGLELARELTSLRPSLPVMMITGSILPVAITQELTNRRWTYLSKPCHLSHLESVLESVLRSESNVAA